MTTTAVTSYNPSSTSDPRLVILREAAFEVEALHKTVVRRGESLLVALVTGIALIVSIGIFHVGGFVPSSISQPIARTAHTGSPNQFPRVVVTGWHSSATDELGSLGSIEPKGGRS
jgi:hypothetical protein